MGTSLISSILDVDAVQALQVDFSQLKKIPKDIAEKIQTVMYYKDGENFVYLLTTNNYPDGVKNIVNQLENNNFKTKIFYTSIEGIKVALWRYTILEEREADDQKEQKKQQEAEGQGAVSIIQALYERRDAMEPGDFIVEMVRLSFQAGASDLHFQPELNKVILRLRLNGVMKNIITFDGKDFMKYLQKLKFMSGVKMNIDYIPQDGRFSFIATTPQGVQKKVDARVNFMPWIENESTVIRFLDSDKGVSTFEQIGFTDRNYELIKKYMHKTTGVNIVTWPTGSWKTTTLYSILHALNDGNNKIITLEDPVEYEVPWIQQSQINYEKGYDYETGLKAILRHDPDIILVGETRSKETAEISINAALTWHLVFTTLHTNSAVASIGRLLSMDVKPYLLAPALQMILAQRLVRKLCPHCKTKRKATYAENEQISKTLKDLINLWVQVPWYTGEVFDAVWCSQCNNTWYVTRYAILELLEIDDEIRKIIIDRGTDFEVYARARQMGYITMQEDGIMKALKGETTIAEVNRVA